MKVRMYLRFADTGVLTDAASSMERAKIARPEVMLVIVPVFILVAVRFSVSSTNQIARLYSSFCVFLLIFSTTSTRTIARFLVANRFKATGRSWAVREGRC